MRGGRWRYIGSSGSSMSNGMKVKCSITRVKCRRTAGHAVSRVLCSRKQSPLRRASAMLTQADAGGKVSTTVGYEPTTAQA